MDTAFTRFHTYRISVGCGQELLCCDLRCKPASKKGLAETIPQLKQQMRNGVGFLRAQIGPDVIQVTVLCIGEVTQGLVEKLTEAFYDEETGTHGYHEVLSLALYLVTEIDTGEADSDVK